jgi:hypothetical protein
MVPLFEMDVLLATSYWNHVNKGDLVCIHIVQRGTTFLPETGSINKPLQAGFSTTAFQPAIRKKFVILYIAIIVFFLASPVLEP